jgi:hypothetical protein
MPLQLVFKDGPTLDLNDAFLVRELGAPVQWHFISELKRGDYGGAQESDFVRLILRSGVDVRAVLQPGGVVICPAARVIGMNRPGQATLAQIDWSGYVGRLDIHAESTAPAPSTVDPFIPRRRVHKAKNLLELLDQFKHIAEPIQRVRNELGRISFADKEKTSIIQDSISDWLFFGHILDQCRFLVGDASWLPLTLVGSVDEGAKTAGKWVITSAARAAFVRWNELARRKISFDAKDGPERVQFGQIGGFCRVPDFPGAQFPTVGIGRPWRRFDAERWRAWRTQDVPRFTSDGDFVWRIQDRISRSDQEDIGWETFVFAVPPETVVTGPFQPTALRPWVGTGAVNKSSREEEPWIQVELEGFENGSNLAHVRLSTPFSGTDGKRGLHFVPKERTKVELCWTGRFGASVVLIGNTRWDASEFEAPSIFLEETHRAQYEKVHVQQIGEVSVDSDLAISVKQGTSVRSEQPLKVHANGADLHMNGGVVRTGRGF